MPPALLDAGRLWKKAGGRGGTDQRVLAQILEKVASSLRCYLVPSGLASGCDRVVAKAGEIKARDVKVQAADFTDGCVPWVQAEAVLEVVMKEKLNSLEDLQAWESKHDLLDNAVVFQFEGSKGSEYLGPLWNHQGIALHLMDLKPA